MNELKHKQNELTQELNVKKVELERAEKRLENVHHAAPGKQNELIQYENDLSMIYKIYVEKIRNMSYLENRLSNFQKYEETSKNSLKGIIEKNKALEQQLIHDQNDEVEIQNMEGQEQMQQEDMAEFDQDDEDGNF